MAATTTEDGSAFAASDVDCRNHLVTMGSRNNGAHSGFGIHGVSDAHLRHLGHHGVPELLVDVFLDQDSRTTKTDLPLVGISGANGGGQGGVEIRIIEHDGCIFPSQFERELFEFRSCSGRDGGPGIGASRKGDGPHMMVLHHCLSDLGSKAMKHIEDTVWKPGLLGPCAQQVSRHGGDFTGLGHDAVSAGQGWGDFPSEQVKRQVPRANAGHHSKGFSQGVVDRSIAHGVAFAGKLFCS